MPERKLEKMIKSLILWVVWNLRQIFSESHKQRAKSVSQICRLHIAALCVMVLLALPQNSLKRLHNMVIESGGVLHGRAIMVA